MRSPAAHTRDILCRNTLSDTKRTMRYGKPHCTIGYVRTRRRFVTRGIRLILIAGLLSLPGLAGCGTVAGMVVKHVAMQAGKKIITDEYHKHKDKKANENARKTGRCNPEKMESETSRPQHEHTQ